MQWGALERKRETWALLMSIVEFVERKQGVRPVEKEAEVKEILQILELEISDNVLKMILRKQSV